MSRYGGFVTDYVADFIDAPPSFEQTLLDTTLWEQRETAREEAFMSDTTEPYTYGKGEFARTYRPNPMSRAVSEVAAHVEGYLGKRLGMCFLNLYAGPQQHLGWHSDDAPEIDHSLPIVVVSFGAEREIWVREKPVAGAEPGRVTKQLLGRGSMFAMAPGAQQTHQHRIPKAGKECGYRISLTFRARLGAKA